MIYFIFQTPQMKYEQSKTFGITFSIGGNIVRVKDEYVPKDNYNSTIHNDDKRISSSCSITPSKFFNILR